MLVELRSVEVYVEPDEILSQAIRDGDLSIYDAISICEDETDAEEILKNIDDSDIQRYCEDKNIEIECDFEMIVKSLKSLTQEQRASLLWFLIGINDEELRQLVTLKLVIPKMNEIISIKQKVAVLNPVWDARDDYYGCVENNIEVNVRAYSDSSLHLWMYDNDKDDELIDAMYKSIDDLQAELNAVLGAEVTLPSIEKLLEVTKGERNV